MSIDISEIVQKTEEAEGPLYLASIVNTEGPCYRKIGGRLLIGTLGRLAGSVSGGCLERELVKKMGWFTEAGPRIETFDTSADGDEEGRSYIGCGGTIQVLLERFDKSTQDVLEWASKQRTPCAIVTVLKSEDPTVSVGEKYAASTDERSHAPLWSEACTEAVRECLSDRVHILHRFARSAKDIEVLVEYVPPPRRLLVAGRHYDSGPMVRLATEAGWAVCWATDQMGEKMKEAHQQISLTSTDLQEWLKTNPYGAMVIMTHSIAMDRICLEAALRLANPPYIGILGPEERTQKLLAAIEAKEALPENSLANLHSPAGVKLGGEGAASIAISVLAELEMTFAYRIPQRGG